MSGARGRWHPLPLVLPPCPAPPLSRRVRVSWPPAPTPSPAGFRRCWRQHHGPVRPCGNVPAAPLALEGDSSTLFGRIWSWLKRWCCLSCSGYITVRNSSQLCGLNLSAVTLMTYQAGCFKLGWGKSASDKLIVDFITLVMVKRPV